MPLLRRRCDHQTAGTHAEGVDPAAALLIPKGQRIVRRRQERTPRRCSVLHPIHEILRMLDAHPDGKRLRLHVHARSMEHRIRVTRRVPDTEKHRAYGNLLCPIHRECSDTPPSHRDVRHLCAKAYLAAHLDNLLTQALHHRAQHIRPDMRLLQIPYLLGRTCRDERLDDLIHARVATARRQLAVGERSRATLAELDI